MEDIVDMESELSKRLQEVMVVVIVIMLVVIVVIAMIIIVFFQTGRRLEEAANSEVGKELGKVETSHSK